MVRKLINQRGSGIIFHLDADCEKFSINRSQLPTIDRSFERIPLVEKRHRVHNQSLNFTEEREKLRYDSVDGWQRSSVQLRKCIEE